MAEVDACSLEIERKYDVIPAVICSMCCLFGIIYCFFGEDPCRLTDLDIKLKIECVDIARHQKSCGTVHISL